MTNSRIKLVTVLDDEEVKDSEMRAVSQHSAALATCTPPARPGRCTTARQQDPMARRPSPPAALPTAAHPLRRHCVQPVPRARLRAQRLRSVREASATCGRGGALLGCSELQALRFVFCEVVFHVSRPICWDSAPCISTAPCMCVVAVSFAGISAVCRVCEG